MSALACAHILVMHEKGFKNILLRYIYLKWLAYTHTKMYTYIEHLPMHLRLALWHFENGTHTARKEKERQKDDVHLVESLPVCA